VREPIKICFISYRAYPLFNPSVDAVFGGAEVAQYLLATELAKDDDFQISFVVGDFGQAEQETIEGVQLIKSIDVEANFFMGSLKIWQAMRRADADIYMDRACSLGTVLYAVFCKIYGRKFVYRTAHTDECDGTYKKKNPLRGIAVKWAFGRADKLIVQNEKDRDDIMATMCLKGEAIKNVSRLSKSADTERRFVLWVARSDDFKRPELYLKLAKEFPDEKFAMLCPRATSDDDYEKLKEDAAEIPNIEFTEKVPFKQVGEFFAKAKVYVNTSESEGFPNTFLQACENSTAIVSLQVNPDGFLDKNNCGLCADGDWETFVEQVHKMLDEPTAAEFGNNARKYLVQNHDVKVIVERYKNIFRDLAGKTDRDQ